MKSSSKKMSPDVTPLLNPSPTEKAKLKEQGTVQRAREQKSPAAVLPHGEKGMLLWSIQASHPITAPNAPTKEYVPISPGKRRNPKFWDDLPSIWNRKRKNIPSKGEISELQAVMRDFRSQHSTPHTDGRSNVTSIRRINNYESGTFKR